MRMLLFQTRIELFRSACRTSRSARFLARRSASREAASAVGVAAPSALAPGRLALELGRPLGGVFLAFAAAPREASIWPPAVPLPRTFAPRAFEGFDAACREIMGDHGRSREITGDHARSCEVGGGHGRSW